MMGPGPDNGADGAPHRVSVFGHAYALKSLLRGLGSSGGAQAYLLWGPPGVGKRTLARYLAQAQLCAESEVGTEPCGACRTCRMVHDGTFPDLHVLSAPVRIEAVRDLQRVLALAPSEAERRFAVLPDFESASIGAANCLLKTLEEPPPHAVLVLTCTTLDRVPATVRSRCRMVPMRQLPEATVVMALQTGWGLEPDKAQLLAGLSEGSLGWAVDVLEDEDMLGRRDAWLEALSAILSADVSGRLARASELLARNDTVTDGLYVWRCWWRDVLLHTLGLHASVVNRDRTVELRQAAERYPVTGVVGALRLIEDVVERIRLNANERLALEVLVLGLP